MTSNRRKDERGYHIFVGAIGESAHELYGANWELAEAATLKLWRSYAVATGLSWADVRVDVRSAWERAQFSPLGH